MPLPLTCCFAKEPIVVANRRVIEPSFLRNSISTTSFCIRLLSSVIRSIITPVINGFSIRELITIALFNALFHFTRKTDIFYLCAKINKAECEDNEFSYIAKISRAITDELKKNIDFFNSYDLIINYYDYGQSNLTKIITAVFSALFNNVELRKVQPADYKLFQVADLICSLELLNLTFYSLNIILIIKHKINNYSCILNYFRESKQFEYILEKFRSR